MVAVTLTLTACTGERRSLHGSQDSGSRPLDVGEPRHPPCLSVLIPEGRVCLCHAGAGGRGLPSARARLPERSWNSYACQCVKFDFSFLSSGGSSSPPCSRQPGMRFPRLGSSAGGLAVPPGLHKGCGNPFGREEPRAELAAKPGPCAGPVWVPAVPGPLGLPGDLGATSCHARVSATLNREAWAGSTGPGIGFFLLLPAPIS